MLEPGGSPEVMTGLSIPGTDDIYGLPGCPGDSQPAITGARPHHQTNHLGLRITLNRSN